MVNIFKHWFTHTKEQDLDDSLNPWAGLASYEDPETAERKLKFCGRDDDSYDLARLIMGNDFVTLYGKSGIGKTSLLNAGVFPELREERYTPVSIRLGMRDEEHPQSYQTMIVEAVERVVKRIETINVIDEQQNKQSIDYLWNYFARHRFYDKYDEPTTPVVVFDQFEEVFRGHHDEAEILLRQLDYLNDKDHTLDSCVVDGLPYRYEQNYRFAVSIREDDLYRLEDSIDNCYLPALKRCRYRLRSLSEEGAHDAILIPGERLFNPDEKDSIAKAIISKSRNDDGSISTNIISLLCSRIYVDFKKSGAEHISPSLVEAFIKGNPFERFYNEATQGFSNKEKSYIEEHLVDSTGRRNSIPESDFLLHVPKGKELIDGDTRILQRTATSSDGGNYRIELIHDSFCELLAGLKGKRERRKRLRQILFAVIVAIFSIAIVVYFLKINHRMNVNMSRVLAEKAIQLSNDQDSYLARLVALQALPPNRPYTVEAERALRMASQHHDAILRGHTNFVKSASFSPDGKHIVSASYDGTVRIWDAQTGLELQKLEGHTSYVLSASFSPDGNRIVSASADNTVRIWDAQTGRELQKLEGHTDWVNSASFSPNGRRIVSASADYTVRIWDAQTGRELRKLQGHTSDVNSASFSPDGKRIVSASWDETARIWDAQTGQELQKLEGHTGSVYSASFSPDGKRIVSASRDKTVRIWDAQTGQELQKLEGHTDFVQSASFSPDGKRIVSASADYTVRIWDANTGQELQKLEGHTGGVNSASFSPDGKRIVSASYDKTVRIWDVRTGQELQKLEGHTGGVNSASFSPDGKRIVFASYDNTIRIWDALTGRELRKLEGHTGSVYAASFSPDGKRIVSASADNTVRIWDANTGQELQKLEGHAIVVFSASFSPDGKRIVSASLDFTIRIWDANTGQELQKLQGHTDNVISASFSPDGKRIVSASWDETVRIWDANTGQELQKLEGHTNGVNSASFSPDGKRIVSASYDNTVRIWDANTGQELQKLEGHTSHVNSASFSPDGKRIVSASDDETVRIWDFPSLEELIEQTRERFKNRQLTPEERRKYYLE